MPTLVSLIGSWADGAGWAAAAGRGEDRRFTGASGGMAGAMLTPSEGSGGPRAGCRWDGRPRAGTTPGWGAGPAARTCSVRNSPVGEPRGAGVAGLPGGLRVGSRGAPEAWDGRPRRRSR